MTVTDIKQQKNDKSRYSVYIDGNYEFSLIMEDILYFRLKIGEPISEDTYRYITETTLYIKAQNAALKFLGYKMRTEKEVLDKLIKEQYSEEIIARVMEFLIKYDYINDREYCRRYIKETLKLRPKGIYMIKSELKAKGIDEDTADEALEEAQIDELGVAEMLLEKKYEGFAEMDQKELTRVYGYLQRRGFSFGITKEAVAALAEKRISYYNKA